MADNLTPDAVAPLTKSQPQVAQLEIIFKGPLVKGSQVDYFDQLWDIVNYPDTANNRYHYQHKLVWVKERRSFYYLDNGDGLSPINWKKAGNKVTLERWDPKELYLKGECCYLSGKIYVSLKDDNINHTPLSDYMYDNVDDWWLCVAGETETYRYVFGYPTPTNSFIIYTEIRNPKFECFFGDLKLKDGEPVINPINGLIEIENLERVDPVVIYRPDLTANDGLAYEITFYEHELIGGAGKGPIYSEDENGDRIAGLYHENYDGVAHAYTGVVNVK